MNLLERPRGRKLLFALLYVTEGAPIGFIWWALPTILREEGLGTDRIGALTSVLVLPWALKFLWAPLLDQVRGPRFAERGWIVASQVVMAAALVPLFWRAPGGSLALLQVALVVHAVAAATQDVAIDALAVRATPAGERGSVNAWMNAGMIAGRSLFSGGALWARGRLGDGAVVGALVGCLVASMALSLLYRSPSARPGAGRHHVLRTLRRALAWRGTWFALAFAALGGAGFEALGSLVGPLMVDRALEAPLFFALVAPACMLAGGFAGGRAADRLGRRRAVAAVGVLLCSAIASVALLLARVPALAPEALLAALAVCYLGIGAFTAATYALFMDLTEPELGSTQFSAYMGATNLCESWSARVGGDLAARSGYPAVFTLMPAVSLLSLFLLTGARPRGGGKTLGARPSTGDNGGRRESPGAGGPPSP